MKQVGRKKAIRLKCLDCVCYQPKEVRLCTVTTCPIWPYRMGKHTPATTHNEADNE